MKKITILSLLVIVLFTKQSYSQDISDSQSESGVSQGNIQIRAYYGLPYIAGAFVKAFVEEDSAYTDVKATNTNHIGGSVQYMVTEKIGLGLDYTFAQTAILYLDGVDRYRLSLTKHRITGMMGFHFANGEKIDPVFNVGVGYKLNRVKYTEPGFDDAAAVKQVIPLSIRLGIGFNYFFTDNVGMHMEVGLGGPLAQAGITAMF